MFFCFACALSSVVGRRFVLFFESLVFLCLLLLGVVCFCFFCVVLWVVGFFDRFYLCLLLFLRCFVCVCVFFSNVVLFVDFVMLCCIYSCDKLWCCWSWLWCCFFCLFFSFILMLLSFLFVLFFLFVWLGCLAPWEGLMGSKGGLGFHGSRVSTKVIESFRTTFKPFGEFWSVFECICFFFCFCLGVLCLVNAWCISFVFAGVWFIFCWFVLHVFGLILLGLFRLGVIVVFFSVVACLGVIWSFGVLHDFGCLYYTCSDSCVDLVLCFVAPHLPSLPAFLKARGNWKTDECSVLSNKFVQRHLAMGSREGKAKTMPSKHYAWTWIRVKNLWSSMDQDAKHLAVALF